ncbi:MAG TPA: ferritin family protein [Candidatus Baltobacteraceae bacterium]|jgi:rubrerythrin|nr:ferritin family protein [Candidatus Baltobacteraceae bacterium]
MRSFQSLDQREILALAVALEEEHARIYDDFADGLREHFPEQAEKFRELRRQEDGHRHRLLDLFRSRFGDHVPLIRRGDIKGFLKPKPVWQMRPLRVKTAQKQAELMELETKRFYEAAARQATDAGIRQLLGDLAEEERDHANAAEQIAGTDLSGDEAAREKRLFALQVIQPGLVGLMDGSVSTLAPLFAAAFSTHKSGPTFLVGLAASLGAGISMGFAEALSDDGTLTGRGHPWLRGVVCGLMTTLGGLGHTLPYLISNVRTATIIAVGVVCVELSVISWVRHRFMDTPLSSALLQVGLGGALVFLVGMLIGIS